MQRNEFTTKSMRGMLQMNAPTKKMFAAGIATVLLLLATANAHAASSIWTGGVDSSFLNGANWSDGVPGVNSAVANSTTDVSDVATFYSGTPNFLNPTLDAEDHRLLGGLVFDGASTIMLGGLSGAGGRQLNLSGEAAIDIQVLSGSHVISGAAPTSGAGDLYIRGDQVWDIAAGAELLIDARTTRNSNMPGITKQGVGRLIVGGNGNGGSGGMSNQDWQINDGILQFAGNNSKGASTSSVIISSGATLELNAPDSSFYSGASNGRLMVNGSGFGGQGAIHVLSDTLIRSARVNGDNGGRMTIETDSVINVDAGATFDVSLGMKGEGTLTKTGAGTLEFKTNNAAADYGYNAPIIVQEGTLLVNSAPNDVVTTGDPTGTNQLVNNLPLGLPITSGMLATGTGIEADAVIGGIDQDGARAQLTRVTTAGGTGVEVTFHGISHALNNSPVTVQTGATLGGIGRIEGSAVTVEAGGFVSPGNGVGTFSVGSLELAGTLAIGFEFDGVDASVSKLNVIGELNLNALSTLSFDNLGALDLPSGDYVVAEYGSLMGTEFGNVSNLPAGFTLDYNYLGNNQIALVGATVPGDFNGDGNVDGADFVVWQTNFPNNSGGATLAMGDGNGDGNVDGADFVIWQTSFPTTSGSTTAVPEPSAIILAGLASLAVAVSRRRRRDA